MTMFARGRNGGRESRLILNSIIGCLNKNKTFSGPKVITFVMAYQFRVFWGSVAVPKPCRARQYPI